MKFPFRLPMLLDGATATNLMADGMPSGVCVEKWICNHPASLQKLQQEYIQAGADALYAPTFRASAFHLKEYGLEHQVEKINRELVRLSLDVAKPAGVLVGGDLSPSGLFVPPYGESDFDDIYDQYREQVRALEEAGVDFFIIETQTSLADMRAAVLATRTTNLPVFVTITVDSSGHTLTGGSLLPTILTLQAMDVDAIGLNCCDGPASMLPLLQDIVPHTRVPLIAKPNAGPPDAPLSPADFAEQMKRLLEAGVSIVGGCCGTTPAHLAALRQMLHTCSVPEFREEIPEDTVDCYAATIETEAFFLSDNLTFSDPIACSVGLGDDLIDLDDERVNVALVKIHSVDDARMLAESSHMSRLPIAVEAESLPVLDAALRYFQGRLIVSTDCTMDLEHIETLTAKYGAILY